jgi:hypothetical protein
MSADAVAVERLALRAAQLLERVVVQIREGNVKYAWSLLDSLESARKAQQRTLELLSS